jgi:hypothetical protein
MLIPQFSHRRSAFHSVVYVLARVAMVKLRDNSFGMLVRSSSSSSLMLLNLSDQVAVSAAAPVMFL